MIYKCSYCEHYFAEEDAVENGVGSCQFLSDCNDTIIVCPECGHDDLEEMSDREVCEELEYWKDAFEKLNRE